MSCSRGGLTRGISPSQRWSRSVLRMYKVGAIQFHECKHAASLSAFNTRRDRALSCCSFTFGQGLNIYHWLIRFACHINESARWPAHTPCTCCR